jgi:NTP pyrophosphatase (non-canonical NTP hydrolase)
MAKHCGWSLNGQTYLVKDVDSLARLREQMRNFSQARDWEQFHDPKSLLLALVGEVGELSELLQWLPAAEAADLAKSAPLNTRLGEELSDVLLYLIRLADVCEVDLGQAVQNKLAANELRFTIADVHGDAPIKE